MSFKAPVKLFIITYRESENKTARETQAISYHSLIVLFLRTRIMKLTCQTISFLFKKQNFNW